MRLVQIDALSTQIDTLSARIEELIAELPEDASGIEHTDADPGLCHRRHEPDPRRPHYRSPVRDRGRPRTQYRRAPR
jgi:hypothetical protein